MLFSFIVFCLQKHLNTTLVTIEKLSPLCKFLYSVKNKIFTIKDLNITKYSGGVMQKGISK